MTRSPLPLFFGTYDQIVDSAAASIAERRKSGDLQSWLEQPTELIVPSAAVAASLTEAITRKTGGTAGVRIEPIDRFAMRLLSLAGKSERLATSDEQTIAMQVALKGAALEDPIFATPGIVPLLTRSWRDAADSGVTLAELTARQARHPHPERFASVTGVWQRYEKLLESASGRDPAWLLHTARQLIPSVAIPRQIIFGFYDVTQLQERFLQALKRSGKVEAIYFPFEFNGAQPAAPYAFASRLVQRLLDGEEPVRVSDTRGPEAPAPFVLNARGPEAPAPLSVVRRTTRAEEHDAICASIAARLAAGSDITLIGVVKRMLTPLDVDLLQRSARAHGFEFNRDASQPIISTRLGRAVAILLDLRANDFPRDSVVELAAAGMKSQVLRSARSAARLDEISRRCEIVSGNAAEADRLISRSRDADRDGARDYVVFVEELERITHNIPEAATGAQWKKTIDTLLGRIDAESETDLAAAAAIDEISATLLRFSQESFSRNEVSALFRDKQLDGKTRRGVWLSDVMHARGLTFEHLYLLSAEDDQFPQRRSDDPILPDSVRDHFGIRQIGDGEAEERLLFELMRNAARQTFTASFATAEQGGRLRRPSRLLVQLAIDLFPDERGAIVSDFARWAEKRFGALEQAPSVAQERRESLLAGATAPGIALQRALLLIDGVRKRSRFDGYLADAELNQAARDRLGRISPTRLERFGDCPQKFLFTSLLKVDELETPEVEIELEAKKRGKIQHQILEQFYQSLDENDYNRADTSPFARLNDELAARLRGLIDEHLDALAMHHPPVNATMRQLDREKIQKSLNRFVGLDLADLSRRGYRPRHFEFKFGDEGGEVPVATLQLGDVTLSVRGMIDRVDQHSDGRIRVVDYKSGTATYVSKISELAAAGRALQLPLYALAWSGLFSVPPEMVEGCIRPLGAAVIDDDDFAFNLGELREPLIETLSLFAKTITDGSFPAFPGNGCRFCAVNHSCRAFFDAQERLVLSGFKNARDYLLGAATP